MRIQQLTVGMMGVCCYVVSCQQTGEAVIIDPGGDTERVLAACKDLQVLYLIATHGHPDHVCGNAALQKATGAKIVMHEDDAAFFGRREIADYFAMLRLPESPPADLLVRDGDHVRFGREDLAVIHTPGHTPGGICLYSAPNCFTGDSLFAGGVGRTDFPGGSHQDLRHSLQARILRLPPETVVWPGHGYGGLHSTIGEEAASNPYLA